MPEIKSAPTRGRICGAGKCRASAADVRWPVDGCVDESSSASSGRLTRVGGESYVDAPGGALGSRGTRTRRERFRHGQALAATSGRGVGRPARGRHQRHGDDHGREGDAASDHASGSPPTGSPKTRTPPMIATQLAATEVSVITGIAAPVCIPRAKREEGADAGDQRHQRPGADDASADRPGPFRSAP